MNLAPEHQPCAVLILANGKRAVIYSPAIRECVDYVIAQIGPRYFAGYILNPQNKSVANPQTFA